MRIVLAIALGKIEQIKYNLSKLIINVRLSDLSLTLIRICHCLNRLFKDFRL